RRASDALLDRRKIIDCDHPTQPTTTLRRSCPNCLAKRRLIGGRVIQDPDYLQIVPVRQWQDPVAGAEPRMEPAVAKGHPQLRSEPPCRGRRAFRPGSEGQGVQMHARIVAGALLRRAGGLFPGLLVLRPSDRPGDASPGPAGTRTPDTSRRG